MNESEAQRHVEQHLAWCNELLWGEEEEDRSSPEGWEPFGPYCGCDTCVVREILASALELDNFVWVEDGPKMEVFSVPVRVTNGPPPRWSKGSDRGAQDGPQVPTD